MKLHSLFLLGTLTAATVTAVCPAIVNAQDTNRNYALTYAADDSFNAADAKLNKVYKKLVAKLDSKSRAKLTVSERAWVAYRENEGAFESSLVKGTAFAAEEAETKRSITQARTSELTLLLNSQRTQGQRDANAMAQSDFQAAGAKLNVVYKQIMAHLVTDKDKAAQDNLKAAQRAWIAFRDSEADFHADALQRGVNVATMEYIDAKRFLAEQRTKDMEKLVEEYWS